MINLANKLILHYVQLADSYWANLFTLLLKCYVAAAAAAAAYHPSKFTPTFHEKLRITTVRDYVYNTSLC